MATVTSLLALLLCLCSLPAMAAEDVVFRGVPSARVFGTVERDDRQTLEGEAAQKAACVIVRRGNKYYWASRDNVPVTRTDAEHFTYFTHPGGMGYVKVFTGERASNPPADYIEHVSRGFETITYWGRVEFKPRAQPAN